MVLSGLNRRVERRTDIGVFAIDDSESIDAAVAACWGTQDV